MDLVDKSDMSDIVRGGKIYKTFVTIDEQNKFWVVMKNGIFIRNPTKKDLERAKTKSYSPTNICPVCREEWKRGEMSELTDDSILYSGNALHETDINGRKMEEYVCRTHGIIHYDRYNPNSRDNIRKSLADHRTGRLKDPGNIFAENCQKLTCELYGVDDLNKKLNCYNTRYDHSYTPEGVVMEIGGILVELSGKRLQTKGAHLSGEIGRKGWSFGYMEGEWGKDFDFEMLWCISKDGLNIDRGYMIPRKEIYNLDTKEGIKSITIYKNPSRWSQYEQYRITDKEFINKADKIWKKIINDKCS